MKSKKAGNKALSLVFFSSLKTKKNGPGGDGEECSVREKGEKQRESHSHVQAF
jgi:hypothetical protein